MTKYKKINNICPPPITINYKGLKLFNKLKWHIIIYARLDINKIAE